MCVEAGVYLLFTAKVLTKNYTHNTKPVIILMGILLMVPCVVNCGEINDEAVN